MEDEPLFRRTKELSYEARKRALTAAENDGETALTVDPFESPLWAVGNYDPSMLSIDTPEKRARVERLADEVAKITSEILKPKIR